MTGPRLRDLRDPGLLLALGLGAGLVPRAPGTAGSAVGVLAYAALGLLPGPAVALGAAALAVAGIPLCALAARRLGRHDHPAIVIDEVAGFVVTMIGLPAEPAWVIAGFVAFRVLDIAKPWPIGLLDRRVGGGLGIMLDDLAAGVAACGLLHAVRLALGG